MVDTTGKRPMRILTSKYPDKKFHFNKREALLSVDWVPLIRLEPKAPKDCTIRWKFATYSDAGVNKEEVLATFAAASGAADDSSSQWET